MDYRLTFDVGVVTKLHDACVRMTDLIVDRDYWQLDFVEDWFAFNTKVDCEITLSTRNKVLVINCGGRTYSMRFKYLFDARSIYLSLIDWDGGRRRGTFTHISVDRYTVFKLNTRNGKEVSTQLDIPAKEPMSLLLFENELYADLVSALTELENSKI